MTAVIGIAAYANSRWGFISPALFGLVGAATGPSFAAVLFDRRHRRPLLPIELRWLTVGCFLAFWFYDEFLRIAVMLTHAEETQRNVIRAIFATLVDFTLVWGILRCINFWATKRYGLHETEPSPNMRGSGP